MLSSTVVVRSSEREGTIPLAKTQKQQEGDRPPTWYAQCGAEGNGRQGGGVKVWCGVRRGGAPPSVLGGARVGRENFEQVRMSDK